LGLDANEVFGMTLRLPRHIGFDILVSLINIAGDIEGISRSLGDSKTV
jgi:hypothetical protein